MQSEYAIRTHSSRAIMERLYAGLRSYSRRRRQSVYVFRWQRIDRSSGAFQCDPVTSRSSCVHHFDAMDSSHIAVRSGKPVPHRR